MSDLNKAMHVSASGLKSQAIRMRVAAENLANADSTGQIPGAEPYRRKTVSFQTMMDKELGVETVNVSGYGQDMSDFKMRYDPEHPAANEKGYVLLPNVNTTIENLDMKEAQHSYEANLTAIENSRKMLQDTLDLLR